MRVMFFETPMAVGAERNEVLFSVVRSVEVDVVYVQDNPILLRAAATFPASVPVPFQYFGLNALKGITIDPDAPFLCPLFVQLRVFPILPSRVLLGIRSMLLVQHVSFPPAGQDSFVSQDVISNVGCFRLYGNFFRVLFSPNYRMAHSTQSMPMVLVAGCATQSACCEIL